MAPVTEPPGAERGAGHLASASAVASRLPQHQLVPSAEGKPTGRSSGMDVGVVELGEVKGQVGIKGKEDEVKAPNATVKGLNGDDSEVTIGAKRHREASAWAADTNCCSLCRHERQKVKFTGLPVKRLGAGSPRISQCQHRPITSATVCATSADTDDDWNWDDDSSIGDVGGREDDDDDEDFVISRSALPKGSVLFERILDEVAPEVRPSEDACVRFSCPRPRSLTNGVDLELQDNGSDVARSTKRRISWADQKGLPLKSEVVFDH